MSHPHDDGVVGGGGSIVGGDPFDYYLGYGHLANEIAGENADTAFAGVQGQVGLGTLDMLTRLLTNPTSGALGLAAAARYGGPQGIASKTGGQGIDTSKEYSLYEKLLQELTGFSSTINAQPEDTEYVEHPGATTPGATPGATPGGSDQFIWSDYIRGVGTGVGDPNLLAKANLGATVPGVQYGGKVKLQSYTHGGVHSLVDRDVESLLRRRDNPPTSPALTPEDATAKYGTNFPPGPPTDEQLNVYGGRELIDAVQQHVAGGGDAESFINQLRNVAALSPMLESGSIRLPEFGAQQPTLDQLLPMMIRRLLEQNSSTLPYPTLAQVGGYFPQPSNETGFAEGGGMVLSGAPHYIVDSEGNKVAALTEDGKPEEVKGVGGVEVVPLDPMRNALYESRKKQVDMSNAIATAEEDLNPTQKVDPNRVPMMTPEDATKVPNTVPKEMAQLQVGGYAMLPEQWHGGGTAGPVKLPTTGGPGISRAEQIGPRDDMIGKVDGNASIGDLITDLDPGGPKYKEQYAKLLGSYMSDFGSQAVSVDAVNAMNQGRAPDKLISQSAFATMDAGAQSDYTQMLISMGVVRSPEHLLAEQRKFAPTALS